jgi:hypothetical protein
MNHMQRSLTDRIVGKTVQRNGKIKMRLDVWGYSLEQETDMEVRVCLTPEQVEGMVRNLSAILEHMRENTNG